MGASDHLENIILDCVFGKIWYSPQQLWLGLSRGDPMDDAAGLDEPPVAAGYQRISTLPVSWNYSTTGVVVNIADFVFPTATAEWGVVDYFVLWDTVWMVLYGELTTPRLIVIGETPRFSVAELSVSLD